MSVFQKILRAGEGRTLKRLHERVHEINALEDEVAALSDDALRAKAQVVAGSNAASAHMTAICM